VAAEVVGTAFVRIRALTRGLNKDIEKAVSKAIKDADFSKASEAFGKSFSDNATKEINDGLKESIEKTDIDGTQAGARMGRSFSQSAAKEINDGIEDTLKKADFTATDTGAGTRFGKETGERFTSALDGHLKAYKKLKLDPGIARNTAKDFDALFTKEEDSVGNTFTRVFSRAFDKALPNIRRRSGASGQAAAKSFGDRLVRGLKVGFARLIPLLTPTLASLVSGITQYIVALAGQIGLLVQAAAGGAVALGAAGASVGLAILPLVAAFNVKSKELDRFKAQGEAVGKAWREFGRSTQRTLLPALSRSLNMTKRLIPVFSRYGAAIGEIVGRNTELLAQIVTGEEGQRRFAEIFEGSTPIVEDFMAIVIDLGDILSNVFIEALPVARQFAFFLRIMVERWRALIQAGSDNGTLAATFQDWFDKARLVFGALGDIVVAIGNIISIGGEGAVPFFDRFDTFAANFRAFTESEAGENKIRQIFEDAYEVAHSFNLLVVDIIKRIGGGIFEEGGNEGLITFFDTLRLKIVPLIDDALRPLIEELGPQLTDFFVAFSDVLLALGESGALEATVQVLTLFADAVTAILEIPGVDKIAGTILGIAGALGALNLIGITGLASSIGSFVLSLAGFTGLTGATGVIGAFGAAFTAAGGGLSAILPALGAVLAPIAAVVAVIAAVIGVIALLIIHWDKVKEAFNATTRFFKDPEDRLIALRENIEDLIGGLRDLGGRVLGIVGRALARFGRFVKEKVEDAIGATIDFLTELPGAAADALSDLGGAAVDALAGFGSTVLDAIGEGISRLPGLLRDLFVGAMQVAITAFVLSFTGIPQLLFVAAREFGPSIGRFLNDAFIIAFDFLVNELPKIVAGVVEFFLGIPGRVIAAIAPLGARLLSFFGRAINSLANWLTGTAAPRVLKFFIELPGRVMSVIASLPGRLLRFFSDAFDDLREVVGNGVDDIFEFFRSLPGRIIGLGTAIFLAAKSLGGEILDGILDGVNEAAGVVGSILSGLKEGLEDLINDAIDVINEGIPNRLGFINIPDNPIPHINLAQGGIFDSATFAQIGEAGREVVIPLTKPKRALELVIQSGLADVLARARGATSTIPVQRTSTAASAGGPPLVQHIYTSDPVQAASEAARRHRALRVALTLR